MHDQVYSQELLISNKRNGYRDILAWIDLSTYRRIPWENNVPFFLVTFRDPITKNALTVDPRDVLVRVERRAMQDLGYLPYAGVEYEVSVILLLVERDLRFLVFQFQRWIWFDDYSWICTNDLLETPKSIAEKGFMRLDPLTHGSESPRTFIWKKVIQYYPVHGYSMLRTQLNNGYFQDIIDEALNFGVQVESHRMIAFAR